MDVILHIGAHRCATTSFQHYLSENETRLAQSGLAAWGPARTRGGLFSSVLAPPGPVMHRRDVRKRAVGRVRMALDHCATLAVSQLLVSDENLLGSIRHNMRRGALYAGAGERVARLVAACDGRVRDIVLNIRSPELYWASALGYGVARGFCAPEALDVTRFAQAGRTWRDVITDIACAASGIRLHVLPFETFGNRPDVQLHVLSGIAPPRQHARTWQNATPKLAALRALPGAETLPCGEGRWMPFDRAQRAALRESYADDLMWLASGADGLATLTTDPEKNRTGTTPPQPDMTRGTRNDRQEGRMANAR
ncbi:MAG: hypothetical protein AB8B51_10285 [Sedimentitalea sp.]